MPGVGQLSQFLGTSLHRSAAWPTVPPSATVAAENRNTVETRGFEPSPVELNLLLEWPDRRSRPEWLAIFAASVAIHLFVFLLVLQLPNVPVRTEPQPRVIVRHIPLYLPPDILTQKAPNRQKISKSIDLADLLASQSQQARRSASPSVKRFEMPKQALPKPVAKNSPQILARSSENRIESNARTAALRLVKRNWKSGAASPGSRSNAISKYRFGRAAESASEACPAENEHSSRDQRLGPERQR